MIVGTQPTFVTLEKMKIPTVMYTGAYGAGGSGVFPQGCGSGSEKKKPDPDPGNKPDPDRSPNKNRYKSKNILVFLSLLLTKVNKFWEKG